MRKEQYVHDLLNLDSKVAVVIGGGGHLCSAMARGLGHAGCKVAVVDLRLAKAQEVVTNLKELGVTASIPVELDVTKKHQHQRVLATVVEHFGGLDIVINGAGINGPTPFLEISLDEWHSILDSQITGTFLGCQVFGSYMVEQGRGSIINISSASAGPPLSKAFSYSVAKAGIKNLTQNLGREWGKSGVRVNAIRPGFFPTDWNRSNFITRDREQAILNHTPMGRYGDPEELVGATIWLASDASSFVTGAEITVDGGFSCMTV